MQVWWIYTVIISFILTVLITGFVKVFAEKLGIVDLPNKLRKKHKGAIPLLGGLAIFLGFFIPVWIIILSSDHFTSGDIAFRHFFGFTLGAIFLMIGGFLDDKYDLPAKISIIFPTLAAFSAVFFGIGVSKITNPFSSDPFEVVLWVSQILTFSWLMIMMYTAKLLDGIDGLATGVTSIGLCFVAALALSTAFFQPDVALLALIALAACLGFLIWNFPKAKIFLGEGGSTFVGYLLGVLAVIAGSKIATALLVVGVPALDVLFVIVQRIRYKKSIFAGDRLHLHQRLIDRGWSVHKVVFFYYGIAAVFGATTLVFQSWQKITALIVLAVFMLIFVLYLNSGYAKR